MRSSGVVWQTWRSLSQTLSCQTGLEATVRDRFEDIHTHDSTHERPWLVDEPMRRGAYPNPAETILVQGISYRRK